MTLRQIVPLNRIFLFCCVFAISALSVSYWAEFFWKFKPCYLCELQRLVLTVVFLLSIFGIAKADKKWPTVLLRWSLVFLLLIAGYQLLTQWGFVLGSCSTPQNIQTLDDFRSMLRASTPCTNSWSLLGLPVSAYNVVFALTCVFALRTHCFCFSKQ